MAVFRWVKELARNDRGNVLAIGAATLPLLIGAAGLGVDTINLALVKRQLQRSADSGALAGAYAVVQEKPVAASVEHDLALNKKVTVTTKTIENAPTAGSQTGNPRAVRVVLAAPRTTPFMSFFGLATPSVYAEATAAVVYTGKFCMVSLEEGTATGIKFWGNTTVNLGCGVATNSKGNAGIAAGGSSFITASPIAAVGGVPASASYQTGTKLLPYSPKQANPYARLPVPEVPANCQPKLDVKADYTVPANADNVYCFKGIDATKGTLTLQPGTYYIDGGSFAAGANGNIVGNGVTIILTSSTAATDPSSVATLNLNGGAKLDLTAPSSGTYGGVIMYQDPRAKSGADGNTPTINGNSASKFEGGFYFPKAYLTFNGTTGMSTKCLQIVAMRLEFTGNSSVSNECPTNGASKAFDAIFVRLVA